MAYGENAACGSALGSSDYYAKEQIQTQRGGALAAGEVKRQPEVPQSVEHLAKAVEYMSQILSELEGRLQPVLSPEAPHTPAMSGGAVPSTTAGGPGTPYASAIYDNAQRIFLMVARVQNMRQRLEV